MVGGWTSLKLLGGGLSEVRCQVHSVWIKSAGAASGPLDVQLLAVPPPMPCLALHTRAHKLRGRGRAQHIEAEACKEGVHRLVRSQQRRQPKQQVRGRGARALRWRWSVISRRSSLGWAGSSDDTITMLCCPSRGGAGALWH